MTPYFYHDFLLQHYISFKIGFHGSRSVKAEQNELSTIARPANKWVT